MKYLIVVDMQKDFVDGALGTKEAQAVVQNVANKILNFDGRFCVTLDTHQKDYLSTQEGRILPVMHCVEDTDGWKLVEPIFSAFDKRILEDVVDVEFFMKPTFGSTKLGEFLVSANSVEPIEEVVLVGLCTDICVISNVLLVKAFLPEVKVTVDAACCAGVTPESHANALRAMQMCQVHIQNWEG